MHQISVLPIQTCKSASQQDTEHARNSLGKTVLNSTKLQVLVIFQACSKGQLAWYIHHLLRLQHPSLP